MASKKRHFQKYLPVLVSQRLVLRLLLLEEPELKDYLLSVLAANLARCRVALIGWAIRDGHYHLSLAQEIDGHDERRVTGIAAFMRNVNAALAKKVNSCFSLQGHVVERAYRSHNLDGPEDLLRALVYIHAQAEHHHLSPRKGEPRRDSWSVLACGEPDGIVSDLPEFWSLPASTPAECAERMKALLRAIMDRALVLERTGEPNPWATATQEAIAVHQVSFAPDWKRLIPVPQLLDAGAHEHARQARLAYKWPRVAFDPRRAPRIGDVITITIKREGQAPPPFR